MGDSRKEFESIRTKLKNKLVVCARCGVEKSLTTIEYHHLMALADGGTNEIENIIPLCKSCHDDWHTLESFSIKFDDFLKLPTFLELALKYILSNKFKDVEIFSSITEAEIESVVAKSIEMQKSNINNNRLHARKKRQADGILAAKLKGIKFGRPGLEYPINWTEVYEQWKAGTITAVKAMELTELKKTSFYKLVKEYENK